MNRELGMRITSGVLMVAATLIVVIGFGYHYLPGAKALMEAEEWYNRPLRAEYHRGENYEKAFQKVREAKEYFRKGRILPLFNYKLEEDISTTLTESKLELVEVLLASANDPEEVNEALEKIVREFPLFPVNKIHVIGLRRRIDEVRMKQKLQEASTFIKAGKRLEATRALNEVDGIMIYHFDMHDFPRSGKGDEMFFYPAPYKSLRLALEAERKKK